MRQTYTIMVDAVLKGHAHETGRPTTNRALQIEQTLQDCFLDGNPPKQASKKTGRNVKTVRRYYAKFKKQLVESQTPDFIQRCKEQKEGCILTYDGLIENLYQYKNDIELNVQVANKTGNFQDAQKGYKLLLKIVEQIASLETSKTNLINAPTADVRADILKQSDKNELQSDKMEETS